MYEAHDNQMMRSDMSEQSVDELNKFAERRKANVCENRCRQVGKELYIVSMLLRGRRAKQQGEGNVNRNCSLRCLPNSCVNAISTKSERSRTRAQSSDGTSVVANVVCLQVQM
jgi:hypothetical protein